jgi:hypothetical protein
MPVADKVFEGAIGLAFVPTVAKRQVDGSFALFSLCISNRVVKLMLDKCCGNGSEHPLGYHQFGLGNDLSHILEVV